MPLTETGREIMANFKRQYGEEQGERYFYASLNAGKIPASAHTDSADGMAGAIADQPIVQTREADCDRADQISPGASNIGKEPPPKPKPDFEHPQDYPHGSAPPEKATGDAGWGMRDASVGYGGVSGGPLRQDWEAGDARRRPGDAIPSGMSTTEIIKANQDFWPQWKGTE